MQEKLENMLRNKTASSETSSSHCEYGCLVAIENHDKLINA